jgi:dihydropteroate synthase
MARIIELGGRRFDLDERPLVMGILNVTPDSFSDGGRFLDCERAVGHALELERQGADIIDIGGESTRPGSGGISAEEEISRVVPVIAGIRAQSDIPLSIDTSKAAVFEAAANAGADLLNDISGLTRDPGMLLSLRQLRLPVIIMHSKGTPDVMQLDPRYDDLFGEISGFLRRQAERALEAGAPAAIIDPGIGFGKTVDHNLQLLKHLRRFAELGFPVAVGPSRKSFIGTVLDLSVDQRLEGTLAATAISVLNGADIIRLHDVREGRRAADLAMSIRRA